MRTWIISGCSTGFGRELARTVLAHGDRAVVTARNPADIEDLVAPYGPSRALACALDVTRPDQVAQVTAAATEAFGAIDVLVNNAGISYFGGIEESDESEIRHLFEVNFFGLMRMTTAVLPQMRGQRSGTVVNIASIAGLNGFASVGYYSASKFAVEGISEALADELRPFCIRVLIVEPSGFRTDWARSATEVARPIADYDATPLREQVEQARISTNPQLGNPSKAAEAIYQDVSRGGSNLHLPLGTGSVQVTRAKLAALSIEYSSLEAQATSMDDVID
jgi:NAD(P)-dependent dehydrogenase (short-subunit alcohol dehydrogenase family)